MKQKTIFLTVLFYLSTAMAQDFKLDSKTSMAIPTYLGKIIFLQGEALKINISDEKTTLQQNERIVVGDTIKTAENTIIKIKMNLIDDSIFTLGPNSSFKFIDSSTDTNNKRKTLYKFISGQLRANFPNKAGPGEIKIELAEKVSMGIRGTELLANIRSGKEENILQVALLKGALDITNSATAKTYSLLPQEHFISEEDSKTKSFKEHKIKLDDHLYAQLTKEENKTFLDFMNSVKELKKTTTEIDGNDNNNEQDENSSGKKSWKQSLKELNRRLKENNK